MKLNLTQDIVLTMAINALPVPGARPLKYLNTFEGDNYLVYDEHDKAPPGFCVRVGKKASVFLIEKRVKGKNLKIHVGLARGKKGDERPITLTAARDAAWGLAQEAVKHGTNPKRVADAIDAAEMTLGQAWDIYAKHLKGRAQPAKVNSIDSMEKARAKLKDWEDRKVRLITSQEIIDRFDLHAVEKNHKTAAEAMGRWATAAVAKAIEREIHDAHAAGRPPALAYNPFTILKTEEKYRTRAQLERDYKIKGVRNPMSFNDQVGPYIKQLWAYRKENALGSDFIFLTLLWGMRRGESATFKWRDRISCAEAATCRWIDMDAKVAFVGDGKNRGDHEFPIPPCSFELLKRRRAEQDEDMAWVFPADSGRSREGHYKDPTCAMKTVWQRTGLKVVRGHDLRRTFGAACEKLNFTDRQIKRMLGHGAAAGETMGRYTTPEWQDISDRMRRVEELILSKAPAIYNALRPKATARMSENEDIVVPADGLRPSRKRAKHPA